MTLIELYKKSLSKLVNPDVEEINVRILLCEINGIKSMSGFYLRKNEKIRDLRRYQEYFQEYLNGKPVQYILGKTDFFGHEFLIDERVLIPRQESEEVVDFAIKKAHQVFGNKTLDVCDVCCGSGIMGVTLSETLHCNNIYFSDISKDAIDVCKLNSKNLISHASYFVGDSLNELTKKKIKVDLLISNPPYILKNEKVDQSVLNYEPHLALFTEDNFPVYERIISKLEKIRKERLLAVFEIGINTKPVLEKMVMKYYPNTEYGFQKDINGKERIFYILLK